MIFFLDNSLLYILNPRKTNLIVLFFAQLIGLLTIVLAPGFGVRSSIVVEPITLYGLAYSFFEALFFNVGDIFLHPGWFLALLSGLVFGKLPALHDALFEYLKLNSVVLIVCLLTTSAGDAFAYPSWYHTMSFYVFVFPVFFSIGFLVRCHVPLKVGKLATILRSIVLTLCILLLVRDLSMLSIRAQHWDRDYITNSLKVENNQLDLVGYNVNYWPLGLGVDDVEKWDWIKTAYVDWVTLTEN